MEPDHVYNHCPCQVSCRAGDSQGHPAPEPEVTHPFRLVAIRTLVNFQPTPVI